MAIDLEESKFLIASLSTVILMALSAYAACTAITQSSIHAIPLALKKSVLTNAYIAVIMGSTIFVYSLILCTLMIDRIKTTMSVDDSLRCLASGIVFGFSAYFAGIAFGEVCKRSYITLGKQEGYYVIFLCVLSAVELVTLFAFLVSLFIVLK